MSASLAGFARAGRKLEGVRVIDCHGHLGVYSPAGSFSGSATDMVQAMDAIGIDVICVSAFLSITADWQLGNDMVGRAIRDYPGRFVGYATINPNYPDSVLPELGRCFDQLAMRGVKLHPDWHHYQADGPSYRLAIEFASERKAFILGHHFGTPKLLESYASQYPDVRFVMAHQAWLSLDPITGQGWSQVIRDMPNVYADIAASLAPYGAFEAMVEFVGPRKVLYGSDAPLHDMGYQIGRVLCSRLGEEDKIAILGANAAKTLGV